ncbi:hypothetical protein QQF64_004748 [Cirrhinus molitorella]|uniref:Uncharacterized protein n=2 Tax=Cirrhinus molitorella TaxID=172907 RepID=A0AA88PC33_9TELE|nr:hypothetical protein Q8A67_020559 [Cirrhinus molitorella]
MLLMIMAGPLSENKTSKCRNCSSIPSRLRFFSLKAAVDSNVLTTRLPPQTNALVICRRGCVEERERASHCTLQTSTGMYHIHRPYQSGAHQGPGLLCPSAWLQQSHSALLECR